MTITGASSSSSVELVADNDLNQDLTVSTNLNTTQEFVPSLETENLVFTAQPVGLESEHDLIIAIVESIKLNVENDGMMQKQDSEDLVIENGDQSTSLQKAEQDLIVSVIESIKQQVENDVIVYTQSMSQDLVACIETDQHSAQFTESIDLETGENLILSVAESVELKVEENDLVEIKEPVNDLVACKE